MLGDEFEGRPELVKKRARAFMLERFLIGIVAMYMLFTSSVVTVLAVNGYMDRQTGNTTLEELVSCTSPEGECYQRGQENQAKAVQALIQASSDRHEVTREIVIAAAACAQDNDTVREIRACVDDELDRSR